jgi:hypothetical protein
MKSLSQEKDETVKMLTLKWIVPLLIIGLSFGGVADAAYLFQGRKIFLGNDDNRVFKIGVTGTTAGYNYIALIEDAQQESVSLGDLGYWEMIDDSPSVLRNYDLQFIVRNRSKGKFKIGFEYDKDRQDISYRILEGAVQVKLDTNEYYPTLIIDAIASPEGVENMLPPGAKRYLFFDFNSFDADLRNYYGRVKRLMKNPDYSSYFFYYEASNYDSYYFKTYEHAGKLDTDKMGLSLENGTLKYYQKVLTDLKTLYGTDFADQIIIVSRFGKEYTKELKKYAYEIGMRKDMVVTFWSYDDIE